jgi:hypothetical protein
MAGTECSSSRGKFLITPRINLRVGNCEFRAEKCTEAFHHRGVTVTTKHSYKIHYGYVWKCTICTVEVKRHSKSVNAERVKCRFCNSTTLVQIRGGITPLSGACTKGVTKAATLPVKIRPRRGSDGLGPIIESLDGLNLRRA